MNPEQVSAEINGELYPVWLTLSSRAQKRFAIDVPAQMGLGCARASKGVMRCCRLQYYIFVSPHSSNPLDVAATCSSSVEVKFFQFSAGAEMSTIHSTSQRSLNCNQQLQAAKDRPNSHLSRIFALYEVISSLYDAHVTLTTKPPRRLRGKSAWAC